MRVSALTWENLHQLVVITPNDIIEVTAMVGKEVEELARFWEKQFPGILARLAEQYLDVVITMLPTDSIPTKADVVAFEQDLLITRAGQQHVRNQAVQKFYGIVNQDSTNYAKRAMMALIEYGLGNWEEALHSAGFAQCNFEDSTFDESMETGTGDSYKETLLNSERKKAEVLIGILYELRQ